MAATGLYGFVVGEDGPVSTSKAQATIWTVAILFTLVYLTLVERSLENPEYVKEASTSSGKQKAPA